MFCFLGWVVLCGGGRAGKKKRREKNVCFSRPRKVERRGGGGETKKKLRKKKKKKKKQKKKTTHPVNVGRRLHVRVRHGLPLLDHREVRPLVRHQHGPGAAERRLPQDVGPQPSLHVLDPGAVDARVFQVRKGRGGVADDEGPAVDVDDGLLAEVVPEDLPRGAAGGSRRGRRGSCSSSSSSSRGRGCLAAAAAPLRLVCSLNLVLLLVPFSTTTVASSPSSSGPGPSGLKRPSQPRRRRDSHAEHGQARHAPEVGRALDQRPEPPVLAAGEVVGLEQGRAGEHVAAAGGDDDVRGGEGRVVAEVASAGVSAAGGGGRGGGRGRRRRRRRRKGRKRYRCCRRRQSRRRRCCRRRRRHPQRRIGRVRFRCFHASPGFSVRGACRRRVRVASSRSGKEERGREEEGRASVFCSSFEASDAASGRGGEMEKMKKSFTTIFKKKTQIEKAFSLFSVSASVFDSSVCLFQCPCLFLLASPKLWQR